MKRTAPYPRSRASIAPSSLTAGQVLPPEVCKAYGINTAAQIHPLEGGQVNRTLLVTDNGQRIILQKLANMFQASICEDSSILSRHLLQAGWEAPTVQPTTEGNLLVTDAAGHYWRSFSFIASDGGKPAKYTPALMEGLGSMLGRWHHTVASLDYRPRSALPHFHDTPYYAQCLTHHLPALPDEPIRSTARELLRVYRHLPDLPAAPPQLIHGDPKLDNMLFRGGMPFTLIDFDTVMYGSPWIDVGDLLRSVTGKQLIAGQPVGKETLLAFVRAYHMAVSPGKSLERSFRSAVAATGLIALELGMRYLCDVLEEDYFHWEPGPYQSRRDHHHDRARLQLQVTETVLNCI